MDQNDFDYLRFLCLPDGKPCNWYLVFIFFLLIFVHLEILDTQKFEELNFSRMHDPDENVCQDY